MQRKVYDREECLGYFQRKYEYMEYEDLDLLYDMALDIFLNTKYPFRDEVSDEDIQSAIQKHSTWCLRCMQEMIEKMGISNVVGYSENGVSITFDKAGISQSLLDEIVGEADIR